MRTSLTRLYPCLTAAVVFLASCAEPQPVSYEATRVGAPTRRQEKTKMENTFVVIETTMGTITAELWADKAEKTVENFLGYVDDSFFDGLIFHRVIPDFMIQGGGFSPDMNQKAVKAPVKNEASSDVKNERGTLAMARTMVVDSATAQFFINLKDNGFLNHQSPTPQGFGYCVFGKVTDGMDVVDKIAAAQTGSKNGHSDVPLESVIIKSIKRK